MRNLFKKKKPCEEMAQHVLDTFDFELVRNAMACLDWTWCSSNGATPSIDQLKKTAWWLLKEIYQDNGRSLWIGTGGFVAGYSRKQDYLWLQFQLEYTTSKFYGKLVE